MLSRSRKLIKSFLNNKNGASLAEFAVVTAMMATFVGTSVPKFSEVMELGKERKTIEELDKIIIQGMSFYNETVKTEGRGRFPGQSKYNETVPDNNGGYATEDLLLAGLDNFTTYDAEEAGKWASIFGRNNDEATAPSGNQINPSEDDNDNGSFDLYVGAEEFLNEFGGNAIKSPFQDGHYIYTVIAGSGSGTSSVSPILYIADLESPKNFNKKLQP